MIDTIEMLKLFLPAFFTALFIVAGNALLTWKKQAELISKIEHLEEVITLKFKHQEDAHVETNRRISKLEQFYEDFYKGDFIQKLKSN